MKTHHILVVSIFCTIVSTLPAEEKPWSPAIDYNVDRRISSGDPITSPWDFDKKAQDAEYRLLYLLQAHKDAVTLSSSLVKKRVDGRLTQKELVTLRSIAGNLNEVIQSSYRDVTPYFSTRANPTLLLMMLYHFEVYCSKGDSSESWPGTIRPLQELDPEITTKAKALAKEGH